MSDRDVIVDATPALQRSDGFRDLAEQMRKTARSSDYERAHTAADDILIETLKRCALLAAPTHPEAAEDLEAIAGAWLHHSADWWWS